MQRHSWTFLDLREDHASRDGRRARILDVEGFRRALREVIRIRHGDNLRKAAEAVWSKDYKTLRQRESRQKLRRREGQTKEQEARRRFENKYVPVLSRLLSTDRIISWQRIRELQRLWDDDHGMGVYGILEYFEPPPVAERERLYNRWLRDNAPKATTAHVAEMYPPLSSRARAQDKRPADLELRVHEAESAEGAKLWRREFNKLWDLWRHLFDVWRDGLRKRARLNLTSPRAKVAARNVLDPLLQGPQSGFVERAWWELSSHEQRTFIQAGLAREEILLERATDSERARSGRPDRLRLVQKKPPKGPMTWKQHITAERTKREREPA